MYSTFQRLNNVSAFATTVLFFLLAAISATTFIIPAPLVPASVDVNSLNVVYGRKPEEIGQGEREFAFARFDINADLRPLFNWNTKQVFVYLVAEYSTPQYPDNQVVIWDKIIQTRESAKLSISSGKNKYAFKEITKTFQNLNATFSLQYNTMPHVGILTYGTSGRTPLAVTFPEPKQRA